jgi:hypothetical protein
VCSPAAGLAGAVFHVEVDLTGVGILERPSPEAVPLLLDQFDGLGDALVGSTPALRNQSRPQEWFSTLVLGEHSPQLLFIKPSITSH